MFQYLTYEAVQRLVATARRPPLLEPTELTSELLCCPVCLEFKQFEILMHSHCSRLFCATCALTLLNADSAAVQLCPVCREETRPFVLSSTTPTSFCKPLPSLQQVIDKAQYRCETCDLNLYYEQATLHRCPVPGERVEPICLDQPRAPSVRCEVVSNPWNLEPRPRPVRPDQRLIIFNHNGRQIISRQFNKNWRVAALKVAIGRLTGSPEHEIKIFKFSHRELSDNEMIQDFTWAQGANYISSFDSLLTLPNHTAKLIFQDLGPPPVVPRLPADFDREIEAMRREFQPGYNPEQQHEQDQWQPGWPIEAGIEEW